MPCPQCGAELEFDEVDIGVGVQRGNYRCPECHWVPEPIKMDRLTRHEQLEGLADRGTDTWEEFKEEK